MLLPSLVLEELLLLLLSARLLGRLELLSPLSARLLGRLERSVPSPLVLDRFDFRRAASLLWRRRLLLLMAGSLLSFSISRLALRERRRRLLSFIPSELRRLLREGLLWLLVWLEWPELELLLVLLLLLRVEFRSLLRREFRSLLLGVPPEFLGVEDPPLGLLLRDLGVTDWTCRRDWDLRSIMLLRLLWLSRLLRLMLLMLQLRFSGAEELIPPLGLAALIADMEMLFRMPGRRSSLLLLLWLLAGRDDRRLRLGFSSESNDVVLMAFFRVLRRMRRSPLLRGLLVVLADSE